jgi:hypothetical protein
MGKDGVTPLANDFFHMDWSGAQPTHLKFSLQVFVAFTAPVVTVSQS